MKQEDHYLTKFHYLQSIHKHMALTRLDTKQPNFGTT